MTQRTIEGDAELIRAFGRLSGCLQGQVIGTALRGGGYPILNDAKQRAPFKTGTYRRSMTMGELVIVPEGRSSIEMGSDQPQARALELGSGLYSTSPTGQTRDEAGRFSGGSVVKAKYKIAPAAGGVLAFAWGNAAVPAGKSGLNFFRFVMHPGIHPQPHWVPAFEAKKDEAADAVGKVLGAAITAAGG